MALMRLFLGIDLPDTLRGALEGLQKGLPPGRPVPWENFHLTLVFLGDVPEPLTDELDLALDGMRFCLPPITLSGLGQFGSASPRAIWVGVTPLPPLEALHRRLANAARRVGCDIPSRRFVPHVTLTRFARDTVDPIAVARAFEKRGRVELPAFQPYALTLFRSHLRTDGPVYEPLADYPITPDPTI
ncbi:RNA 2',3'-cyclic phosphodiesterase [Boseongicola aestuarii]|nr:RNA 2',3'-cyclic phosphodiesterase [Boseongicola aestuarii]